MESPHVISSHREIATALLASNNIKIGSTWSDSVQPPVLQHFLNRLIFILQPLLAQEGGLFKLLLQAACPVCFGHWSSRLKRSPRPTEEWLSILQIFTIIYHLQSIYVLSASSHYIHDFHGDAILFQNIITLFGEQRGNPEKI